MPETGFVEANGARLYCEVAGEGYPLVLIHGGLVHGGLWEDQVDAFAQRFRTIRYDARGHGRSPMTPGAFAPHEDLRELLDALGIARAHLCGLSMGGGIALDLALEHPALVSGLVLVGSAVSGYEEPEEVVRGWAETEAAYEAGDRELAVELTLRMYTDGPNRTPGDVDPAVRERVREMTAHNVSLPDTEFEELEPEPPAILRLSEVRVPTLIVVGGADLPSVRERSHLLHEGIAGAEKIVVPDTAHHPNIEKAADFNRHVLRFLDGLEL
jgi:pimeloyl-ACP methyl ester carboxylesterase